MAKWPYSTRAWGRLRLAKLARDPLCQYCPPWRRLSATQVDHRKAVADGGDPWAWDNLISACASCHSAKTAGADGAFGNPRRPHARMRGCGTDGWPLDPRHDWNDAEHCSGLVSDDRTRPEIESLLPPWA